MKVGILCLLLAVGPARAADGAPGVGLTPGLLQATLGLALVLALIWGAAWLVKRVSPALVQSKRSPIKLIATQAVGQRERVVLIEVGDRWLLLGVAPGQVSALKSLPRFELPTGTRDEPSFRAMLANFRARRAS